MAKANVPSDVFRFINMHGGDDSVCWEWMQSVGAGKGRGRARPYFSLGGKKVIATRVVYELVNGRTLADWEVIRHECDNPICCNPKHLQVGTIHDNIADMVERDRHGLPSHVVRRVRVLLSRNRTHQEIADLYGLDRSVVTRIANDALHTHANDYPTKEDHDAD